MLTSALLLMLASADVQPAFLADGAPRSVRLVQDTPPAPDLPSYAGWSRPQLQQEYARLKDTRPGLGLPIALMSSGGGAAVLLLYAAVLALGTGGGLTSITVPLIAVFAVMGIGGAAMIAIGGILLSRIIPERRPYSLQMDEIDRLLKEGTETDERRYVPDGSPVEGPPPPPPPAYAPQSSLQLPLIFVRF